MDAVHSKNEGMVLLLLGWRCIGSVVFAWPVGYMKMTRDEHVGYLNLNLVTFQHLDGFGCYHFSLSTFGLELIIFF